MTPHEGQYIYLGSTDGLWPLAAFTEASQATWWLSQPGDEGRRRRVCRVKLADVTEQRLLPAQPASMEDMP